MPRAAVFLDRDGTVNLDTGYVRRLPNVALVRGAGQAIARLNAAGVPVVIITNQSGIGRGLLSMEEYERIRARIDELLAADGAHVDATYHCPHDPTTGRHACACRKPGTALFRQAAVALDLSLERSWYVGDRWRDVSPALEFGGEGLLVPGSGTPDDELRRARERLRVLPTLGDVVDAVLASLTAAP
ncbi:MAG TPA: HAD family hydrolase [Gemmatimonadaceae bacterium]|jgi:histidinol-phosphate phosphatase family protein